jgi:hypothetical protein
MLQLQLHHQISIAWELDEALFFFLLLFLSLESFPCLAASSFFAAAGGCVASRCCWIAANGSSWNCGLFSTAFRWAASRSLKCRVGFRVQTHRPKRTRAEAKVSGENYTKVCLDLQFSFASVFCSGAAGSGRNSESAERSYAFSFFCRRLWFCFCTRITTHNGQRDIIKN